MRTSVKITLLSTICASMLCASGYRIPEQSFASVAKSAANVANTNGADASYFNPANMAFMDNGSQFEMALNYIGLTSVKYIEASLPPQLGLNSKSQKEHFLIPAFHYVSPIVKDNWRFGLSIVAPGGLSKRWNDPYGKAFSQEFSLQVVELNPTASYLVVDNFAVGLGLRGLYVSGVVKSDNSKGANRDLEGDALVFGYNLALSYRPIENLTLATTYRSKVDLAVDGTATLANGFYKGGATVSIPLPAVFSLAAAYKFGKTTLEAVYERTYWSSYKELDFNYDKDLTKTPLAPFDTPIAKNWKDTNTYRIGVTHELNDKFTLLGGFAIDKNPIPDKTLGFELPDSDGMIYSAGLSYKMSEKMTLGLGYLYSKKDKRSVNNRLDPKNPATGLHGKFENSAAHFVSTSLVYEF